MGPQMYAEGASGICMVCMAVNINTIDNKCTTCGQSVDGRDFQWDAADEA